MTQVSYGQAKQLGEEFASHHGLNPEQWIVVARANESEPYEFQFACESDSQAVIFADVFHRGTKWFAKQLPGAAFGYGPIRHR